MNKTEIVLRANITNETLSKYNDGTWDDLYSAKLSLEHSMYEYLEMLKNDSYNSKIIDIARNEVFNIKITLEEINRMLETVYMLEDAFIDLRIRKTSELVEILKNYQKKSTKMEQ